MCPSICDQRLLTDGTMMMRTMSLPKFLVILLLVLPLLYAKKVLPAPRFSTLSHYCLFYGGLIGWLCSGCECIVNALLINKLGTASASAVPMVPPDCGEINNPFTIHFSLYFWRFILLCFTFLSRSFSFKIEHTLIYLVYYILTTIKIHQRAYVALYHVHSFVLPLYLLYLDMLQNDEAGGIALILICFGCLTCAITISVPDTFDIRKTSSNYRLENNTYGAFFYVKKNL